MNALNKTVQIRHMRQDVVADDHVGGLAARHQLSGQTLAEESARCRYASLYRCAGRPFGRIDPENRYATLNKVFQQVTIIASQLNNETAGVQMARINEIECVGPGVLQ